MVNSNNSLIDAATRLFKTVAEDEEGVETLRYLDRAFWFRVDGEEFCINVRDGQVAVTGDPPDSDDLVSDVTVIETSLDMVKQLLSGAILPTEFVFSGRAYVSSMGSAMPDNNAFFRLIRRAQELLPRAI